jgi:hypothetical protein
MSSVGDDESSPGTTPPIPLSSSVERAAMPTEKARTKKWAPKTFNGCLTCKYVYHRYFLDAFVSNKKGLKEKEDQMRRGEAVVSKVGPYSDSFFSFQSPTNDHQVHQVKFHVQWVRTAQDPTLRAGSGGVVVVVLGRTVCVGSTVTIPEQRTTATC